MGPRLLAREDEDVSDGIREILESEGIQFRLNATCISLKRAPDATGVIVGVDCQEGEPRVEGTHLLLAVGRVPNTDDLELQRAAVETDKRGYIKVDDQCRTNVPGIGALGDCTV